MDTARTSIIEPAFARRVERFFGDFDEDFASFDGDLIARRYAEPYVACRDDGSCEAFPDRGQTGRYFDGVLDHYRAAGARTCRHDELDIVAVGDRHLLATVTWELLDRSGGTVVSWRESYVLIDHGVRLLIRTSIDHPSPSGPTPG